MSGDNRNISAEGVKKLIDLMHERHGQAMKAAQADSAIIMLELLAGSVNKIPVSSNSEPAVKGAEEMRREVIALILATIQAVREAV